MQAETLQYSLDEDQWEQDWASILSLAGQPGTSLEQTHVFALAHILRRPVIIYGVKYVKSFRGEVLGLARFQGTVELFILSYLLCKLLLLLCTPTSDISSQLLFGCKSMILSTNGYNELHFFEFSYCFDT